MPQTRRDFLRLTISGTVLITAGTGLLSFVDEGLKLPLRRKVRLRFAIASDGHFGQPKTDYLAMHEEMVNWINADHARRKCDFSFVNGDIYHDDISFSPAAIQLWQKLEMPWYVSHGNHDHSTEENWEKTWGRPWHYSFAYGKTAFVVLNTADEKGTYVCPDLEKSKQLLAQYKDYEQLFVFMHITPHKWTKNGIDCPELVALFNNQANLKAIFHGHDHDQDNVKESGGKHYFFDSHVAGSWGTEYRGYRIVEVLKNGDILTYQMNPATNTPVNNTRIV